MLAAEPDRCRQPNRLADPTAPVDIIRVPMALGADRDGVDRGAAELDHALRTRLSQRDYPEILRRLNDSIEITVAERGVAVRDAALHPNALHIEAIAAAARELSSAVSASVLAGHLPLVIGGDHALSIGSLAGAALSRQLGVIWIDTHADINTPETSPSGHVHGMPLAAALGRGPRPLVDIARRSRFDLANLVYIGLRDVDRAERELLRCSPAGLYTMESIDELGIDGVVRRTVARLLDHGVERVHVSFDLDVLDPTIMPGTGTRAPGGLTYREAHRLFRLLRASDLPIVSVDVVELNPLLDPSGDSTQVAAGLTAALLGEEMV
jgi:arginase